MDPRFGPSHDRVALTAREREEIDRIEVELASTRRVRRSSPVPMGVRARLLVLCLLLRRTAIWLLPIGSIGMLAVLSTSLLGATAFALAWMVGFAALVIELRSWARRVVRRWPA